MRKSKNTVVAFTATLVAAMAHGAHGAPDAVFLLQTMQLEAEGKCLDSDRDAAQPDEFGGAYMNNCGPGATQRWFAEPAGDGHFKLKTAAAANFCLEGQNGPNDSSELVGAAFMDECRNVSGQLWKAVASPTDGYITLKNVFAGEGKCLEGNRRVANAEASGWAFMDNCQSVSGQLWIIGGGKLVDAIPTANRFPEVIDHEK